MKLAFCLFKYFPFGGMQRDFLRIARECRARGHEVHVYTMSWDGEIEPDFHIHFIDVAGKQNHVRMQSFVKQLQLILKQEKYDRVIGFNKMPGLDWYYAADVCYQKRAHEKHHLLYRLLPRYKQLVALEQAVFAHDAKTHILAISPFTQAEFQGYYHTPASRFHLLPPGIAPDRLASANAAEIRANVRAQYQLAEQDVLLLMVGSGFKTKGVDRAIRALAALPTDLRTRSRLFVIGQDNAKKFEHLASQLMVADRVSFLGGRSDVTNFFLAADVLVHPAYHENTGTVLLEALAAGLPVMTTDVCGYAHYIKEAKAGDVLPSPFVQANFDKALEAILRSDHKALGHNGYIFAKTADIYSMPTRAVDLIEHVTPSAIAFDDMMQLQGQDFRVQPGRQTALVDFNGQSYFIKKHTGVGWREIFKNLLQLKKPVLGARNEYAAIQKLQSLGVNVPAAIAYAERGCNPATRQSYILLQALTPTISLEELAKIWQTKAPLPIFKRQLIKEVARMARIMHENGINHRDFYICHFLLDTTTMKLSLIDLHRAEIRNKLPERWLIKDLAGLYFSSIGIGLTKRDYLRFMKYYRAMPLREIKLRELKRWQIIKSRGEQLYCDHQ